MSTDHLDIGAAKLARQIGLDVWVARKGGKFALFVYVPKTDLDVRLTSWLSEGDFLAWLKDVMGLEEG